MMKEILLNRGKVALVDDEDYEQLMQWKWHAHLDKCGKWYAWSKHRSPLTGRRVNVLMHRLIVNASAGQWVDHRDGNGLNNTRSNLRICSNQQNQFNRGKTRNNTSGYKGVFLSKSKRKWRAQIRLNGRSIHLGEFDDPREASNAYKEAAMKFHGEFYRA